MRHFALQIALIAILGTFIALDICITRIAIANLIVAQIDGENDNDNEWHKNIFIFVRAMHKNIWNYTIRVIFWYSFSLFTAFYWNMLNWYKNIFLGKHWKFCGEKRKSCG